MYSIELWIKSHVCHCFYFQIICFDIIENRRVSFHPNNHNILTFDAFITVTSVFNPYLFFFVSLYTQFFKTFKFHIWTYKIVRNHISLITTTNVDVTSLMTLMMWLSRPWWRWWFDCHVIDDIVATSSMTSLPHHRWHRCHFIIFLNNFFFLFTFFFFITITRKMKKNIFFNVKI